MVHSSLHEPELDGKVGESGWLENGELGVVPVEEKKTALQLELKLELRLMFMLRFDSELPLQNIVGVFGVQDGELGTEGPRGSGCEDEPKILSCVMLP